MVNNAVNAKVTGFQSLNATTGVWNGRTLQAGTNISITNGDGTGGDPVISSSASPGTASVLVDDFINTSISAGQLGDTNWGHDGNGSAQSISGHPGVYRVPNNAVSCLFKIGLPIILGAGELTVEWIVKPSGTSFQMFIGLSDAIAAVYAEPANGCYFQYDSAVNAGNWRARTGSASSYSTANAANALTTNWVHLKIVINAAATSVAYFIDGSEITNSPITTNIPTAGIAPCILSTGTAANTFLDVDLFMMNYVLTSPR